ncbi:MAG TPA: UDP-N-acetylmuramate dehydrogenase, partial [Solirubrobacteraceae bacterium]|nr:UDP-N-acetylmuramate dehydrogenase [Solirubrobacteraceae bacterium]
MTVASSTDTPLAPLTTLRLGGPARRLVTAESEEELVARVREADAAGEPLLVLAGGSNVVVADDGFPGLVVRVATRGVERRAGPRGAVELDVQAGEPWDPLVEAVVGQGLRGWEALSGIPGSTGATPIQNVGAYGQEVAATITGVRALDRRRGEVLDLAPAQCGFGYRTSAFKRSDRWVVLRVGFALAGDPEGGSEPIRYTELAGALDREPGDTAPLREVREAVLRLRRAKGMVVDPADPDSVSAGSFFTNPVLDADAFAALVRRAGERPPAFPDREGRVKTSAAWLIER